MNEMQYNIIPELICRTCLKTQKDLVNIFSHFKYNCKISEILTEFTTIEIQKDDGLPMNICNVCIKKLSYVHDFKCMVLESHEKLYHRNGIEWSSNDLNVENDKSNDVFELINAENDGDNGDEKEDYKENFEIENIPSTKLNLDWKNESHVDDNKVIKKESKDLEEIVIKLSTDIKTGDDNVENDTPLKSLDISEYEELKTTLSRKEKAKARLFCKVCKKSYKFNYYFSIHLRMHIGQVPHKCEICGRSFPQPSLLRSHMKIHSENTPHTCEKCGKSFKTLASLYIHKYVHSDKYSHKCSICDKAFKQASTLKVHLKRHNNEKPCICELCGKSFYDRGSLMNHHVTHNTEFDFSCKVCGKLFRTKRSQIVHMKLHSDLRPFVCTYCNKGFKVKSTLEHHVLIHTGDKPYACKVCGKKFRQASCVPQHMKTHTGESPYVCKLCPSKFKYSHHLKSHIKVHHKDEKFD